MARAATPSHLHPALLVSPSSSNSIEIVAGLRWHLLIMTHINIAKHRVKDNTFGRGQRCLWSQHLIAVILIRA
jgi:hypothetical protein